MPYYDHDKNYPFAAFITNLGKYNEGELVGEWVKFPTTAEELKEVFKRIGIGQKDDFGQPYEEWFITDYEATASLDIENELAVKQAIANLLKEKKTVVMIAHTLSIVKNADQILVMGDGRIAESGTHEELLAKGGKYAAMWNAEQKISA